MKLLVWSISLLWAAPWCMASDPDALIGVWFNQEKTAKIEIYKTGGKYFGKIVWLEQPTYLAADVEEADGHPAVKVGNPKVDWKNPDKARQNDPILGLLILRDFVWDADDEEWNDGRIYDPKKGSDYKCFMKLEDAKTLYLRGYIGFSLIGRTSYWTRAN